MSDKSNGLSATRLIHKTLDSLQNEGVAPTLSRIVRFPLRIYKERRIYGSPDIQRRFTNIYEDDYWCCEESKSGGGSTLAYTESLRDNLAVILERFPVKSIFDAPCGDFNWMSHFLGAHRVRYTGADIVLPMVRRLQERFGSDEVDFLQLDLTKARFPAADLMICRDCLFHLSFQDAMSVLQRYVESGIPLILTSTHVVPSGFENQDIKTGDFRRIDLFSAPFYFPKAALFRFADWIEPYPEREMCLWSREQVLQALERPFA